MIKKYFEFSQYGKHNTLGEYIESLCDDDFIKSIVGDYTKDVDPKIRVSNSVNLLDDYEKIQLLKRVESHLSDSQSDEVESIASVTDEIIEESYGKGVFVTFLKCLTALGLKENQPSKEIPNDFLFIFKFDNLDYLKVESTFKRFKSLQSIGVQYETDMKIYFGIKINGLLEYGYITNEMNKIGEFPIRKSALNWIKTSDLKSLSGLKKILSDLSYNDILLMGKIKKEMSSFNPEFSDERMVPIIQDRIINFGYRGYGNWNMGKLNDEDLMKFKDSVKNFLSKFRWSDKVMMNVFPDKFWIFIKLKLK